MNQFIPTGPPAELAATVAARSLDGIPFADWGRADKQVLRDRLREAGLQPTLSGEYLRVTSKHEKFEQFFGGRVEYGVCGFRWRVEPVWPLPVGQHHVIAVWFDSNDFGDTPATVMPSFSNYICQEPLGTRGGMGLVWVARHLRFGSERQFVLKLIQPELAGHPLALVRFAREAKALQRVDHVNVVGIVDYDVRPVPYIVMEYLSGMTIQALVDGFPLPNLARAVNLVIQACHGIDALHQNGFVHRDIKPRNLMVCEWAAIMDHLKVIDLGLVRPLGRSLEIPGETISGQACGTPEYMAPEQFLDAATVDIRADIYSLVALARSNARNWR